MAVISSVRSDDVYNQVPHYPAPDHRTTALAHQAAGLYIALYYVPQVLQKDTAVMRALVDRHFCDCWVCLPHLHPLPLFLRVFWSLLHYSPLLHDSEEVPGFLSQFYS